MYPMYLDEEGWKNPELILIYAEYLEDNDDGYAALGLREAMANGWKPRKSIKGWYWPWKSIPPSLYAGMKAGNSREFNIFEYKLFSTLTEAWGAYVESARLYYSLAGKKPPTIQEIQLETGTE